MAAPAGSVSADTILGLERWYRATGLIETAPKPKVVKTSKAVRAKATNWKTSRSKTA